MLPPLPYLPRRLQGVLLLYVDVYKRQEQIKYKPKEKRALTENEKNAVFKADFNDSDKIFIYLLYGCGLRRGEALALTVFDKMCIRDSHMPLLQDQRRRSANIQN